MSRPTRWAAILVDIQNDFCPGGALPVPNGDEVVGPANILRRTMSEAGGMTIATRDWHPKKTNHFEEFGGQWPTHCVQNTAGAGFHRELTHPLNHSVSLLPSFDIFNKGALVDQDGYSAMYGFHKDTGETLPSFLRRHGIQNLIFCGLATEYCVKASVLDALKMGFNVYVLLDGIRAVDPDSGKKAIQEMKKAGATFIRFGNEGEIAFVIENGEGNA